MRIFAHCRKVRVALGAIPKPLDALRIDCLAGFCGRKAQRLRAAGIAGRERPDVDSAMPGC